MGLKSCHHGQGLLQTLHFVTLTGLPLTVKSLHPETGALSQETTTQETTTQEMTEEDEAHHALCL